MNTDKSTILGHYRSPEIQTFTIGLNGVICGSRSMYEKDFKDGGFTQN